MVQGIPAAYRNVTPYLTIRDVPRAIDFYREAFGAEEVRRQAMPDGRVLHAEIAIGPSRIMMSEEMIEYGMKSPASLGGTPVTLQFFFEDVDAAWKRAVDAGAEVATELMDAFWGDRYGVLADPFGHRWGLAQRLEELSDEEMERRAEKWFATEGK
jgi:PhnB protein